MLFNKRDINALPFTGSTNWQYSGSTIVAKKVSRNQSPHRMISGIQMKWIHIRLKLTLLKVLIKNYDSPLDWVKGLQYLVKLRRRFLGDHALKKNGASEWQILHGLVYTGLERY
jgi:hypothetical protein